MSTRWAIALLAVLLLLAVGFAQRLDRLQEAAAARTQPVQAVKLCIKGPKPATVAGGPGFMYEIGPCAEKGGVPQ